MVSTNVLQSYRKDNEFKNPVGRQAEDRALARNELQRLGHVLADLSQAAIAVAMGTSQVPDRQGVLAANASAAAGMLARGARTMAP